MQITRTSRLSAETHVMEIDVTQEQIDKWEGGMKIQDAMPNIASDEREFIMTGITPTEWDIAMGIDDDVDYESNDDAYGEEDDGQPSEQQEWEDYEGQDPCTEQW
tara:strand:+ start:233 stop:547 length:315 start_codon:yes stop_codon:yes gene_type:complete